MFLPFSHFLFFSSFRYCPQVDPLLEQMTGYETLWFFGKIRGIPHEILEKRVQELIVETDLLPYANIPCGKYSGGNKRKLSLAVALIGNPKVLLLDEVMRVSCL
jgi:ABC-type multidrug transport system ATPase subunit